MSNVSHSTMAMPAPPVFDYDPEDFLFDQESSHRNVNDTTSSFDHLLLAKWTYAMDQGLFHFSLTAEMRVKCLPGKYKLYLQLNPERHSTRRPPPTFSSTREPADRTRFHFGRVPAGEHLLRLGGGVDATDDDCLLINISPVGRGHVLLVPQLARLLPQRLERRGLQRLLDLLLLSRSTGLRGLFNSLGARASVNHYHFQLYYFDHPLYIETAPVERLADGLYQLTAFPAPAFVFEVTRATYADVASRVVALAELILDEGFAFNLVACRGGRCSAPPARPELYEAVRVFVWPRQPELSQEPTDDYQVASCEFAGHITVASAEALSSLTEAGVAESLRTVAEPAFLRLRDVVLSSCHGRLGGPAS